ncbi:hypothetical protein [Streptomyces coeruleorubidus]|uniref:hypothetical protein n=1 Tax=Streptomyces coeruleorubidus TaxID=116188 RepID=UPI0033AE1963
MEVFGINVAYPLHQSVWLLALAYVACSCPSRPRPRPHPSGGRGPSLGRRRTYVLRTVILPLAAPDIGAGAALVFLTCMKELPATLLRRPTGMDTLATGLWKHTSVAAYAAAPYAALLVLIAAVPTWWLSARTGVLTRTGG